MLSRIKKLIFYLKSGKPGFEVIYKKLFYFYMGHSDINRKYERRVLLASALYHQGGLKRFIAIFIHNRNRKKFSCEIYPEVKFEGKIIIPHCVGIVIGKTAVIGDGTKIMPNVVIGAKHAPSWSHEQKRRHAIIGKNCMIGASAVIIGDIVIGDNVTIGAGAVVTRDVPPCSIVTGVNQIRAISKNEDEQD